MFYKSKVTTFITKIQRNPIKLQFLRTFIDAVEIKYIRDRGLDHAVERENDLKPMINLKNLLKLEPSKSLPIKTITDKNDVLQIPFRPIEFIRKYPFVFEVFMPGNIGISPHVKLTEKSLDLDAQECLLYDSDAFRKCAADRLLKLLMICRVNEIPLRLIDMLKWDLGLPDDYVTSLVPEFPDYFQVKKKGVEGFLELVCWIDELAVSEMEKMAKKSDRRFKSGEGLPLEFPMKFSTGFEMDKRLKKWIDEWQKLPYVSPYENATHLQPNSDESDKWAVSVLHELLHILVPKKTERDNLLHLGEYMGIRARFKRAMVHHPGIFYLSSKNRTYTVVLRERYKRGLLLDKHPLMDMRSKYIHLMHKTKKPETPKKEPTDDASKQNEVEEGSENENEDSGKGQYEEIQFVDSDEDESDDDDDEEEEEMGRGRSVNEEYQGKDGGRSGRRDGRGDNSSGRRGFSKANGEGQERGGNRSGRRGFDKTNDRGGSKSGKRGFNKSDEGRERDGRRGFNSSGRRGFSKANGEGQEMGGNRSGRRGFDKTNDRGGSKSGKRGFNKSDEGRERDGRRGFNKENWEGKERVGNRSERRGSSNFNQERSRGGQRSGERESGKVNKDGNAFSSSGGRSGEVNMVEEMRVGGIVEEPTSGETLREITPWIPEKWICVTGW